MKEYSIDFDIIKEIFHCKGVNRVDYRLSSSGQAFHFIWTCIKRTCKHCRRLERKLDDPVRYNHDQHRPAHHRRILWDSKGGKKAGPWKSVHKKEKQ